MRFKDLGLLIVDEEQRFGVTHKERLKKLRTQVDCLTLTATPIPRTLHMALMGLRDLSIITTPPADRLRDPHAWCRATTTRSSSRASSASWRAAARSSSCTTASRTSTRGRTSCATLLPGVRLVVGHGQMAGEELERVMIDFVDGKADVLLCTTIIESGLDIPRANTMFVNRADMFGLAQLYQLRGRIGRARERAFCYLMIPPEESLGSRRQEAPRGLAALHRARRRLPDRVARSRDPRRRRSARRQAVGRDRRRRLRDVHADARGGGRRSCAAKPIHEETDPELTCDSAGFIPDDYLPDVGQRLEFYRRLSSARDEQEVREIVIEITDRYGPPPDEVDILADIMIVKGLGRRLGARAIELTEVRLGLSLADDTPLEPAAVMRLVNAKNSPWKLTPDMRLQRTFVAGERDQRVQVAKKLLADLLGTAKK